MPVKHKKSSSKQHLRRKQKQNSENCDKAFASRPGHCQISIKKDQHLRMRLKRYILSRHFESSTDTTSVTEGRKKFHTRHSPEQTLPTFSKAFNQEHRLQSIPWQRKVTNPILSIQDLQGLLMRIHLQIFRKSKQNHSGIMFLGNQIIVEQCCAAE
ncbi:hypothetical protein Patl1_02922 [Pistacia atlantica]|uniref:Uncharacterized protein n=1 Tax=Pistacia atlantica TaxID=434234 RepID=A0ACC1CD45_9ROSI|nr:hypothetical protein Patl1_02922 [Pistacia atlantica]